MKNKEWLKKEVEDYLAIEGVYDARTALKAVLEYIDQLDEPNEIELSEPSAWKTIAKLYHPNEVYWGNVRDSYIKSLEEQDKVVIPQFVADFITEIKPNFNIRAVFTLQNNNHEQGQEWALDNPDVFAKAWIDGYTVDEENLYKVELPIDRLHHILTIHADSSGHFFGKEHTNNSWYRTHLTEQEIKNIDERFWAFAEEITK